MPKLFKDRFSGHSSSSILRQRILFLRSPEQFPDSEPDEPGRQSGLVETVQLLPECEHPARERDQHRQPRSVLVQPSTDDERTSAASTTTTATTATTGRRLQEPVCEGNSSPTSPSAVQSKQVSFTVKRGNGVSEPQAQRKLGNY